MCNTGLTFRKSTTRFAILKDIFSSKLSVIIMKPLIIQGTILIPMAIPEPNITHDRRKFKLIEQQRKFFQDHVSTKVGTLIEYRLVQKSSLWRTKLITGLDTIKASLTSNIFTKISRTEIEWTHTKTIRWILSFPLWRKDNVSILERNLKTMTAILSFSPSSGWAGPTLFT